MAEIIKSVRRVAEILEEFSRVRKPLSLKNICALLDCAPSSGSAMLKSLVALGYLGYDRRTRTYLPTMRLTVFSEWVPQELLGRHGILETLHDLRDRTGLHAYIATQSDLYVQYVHIVSSDTERRELIAKPGTLLPIARTTVGRALLSTFSDEEVERLIRRVNFFERQPELRVDLEQLMPILNSIRACGYAFGKNVLTEGFGVIATSVTAKIFDRIVVVGIGGDLERVEENFDEFRLLVCNAAKEIAG